MPPQLVSPRQTWGSAPDGAAFSQFLRVPYRTLLHAVDISIPSQYSSRSRSCLCSTVTLESAAPIRTPLRDSSTEALTPSPCTELPWCLAAYVNHGFGQSMLRYSQSVHSYSLHACFRLLDLGRHPLQCALRSAALLRSWRKRRVAGATSWATLIYKGQPAAMTRKGQLSQL